MVGIAYGLTRALKGVFYEAARQRIDAALKEEGTAYSRRSMSRPRPRRG